MTDRKREPAAFLLILEARVEVPSLPALRRLLKSLGRYYGFTCRRVERVTGGEAEQGSRQGAG